MGTSLDGLILTNAGKQAVSKAQELGLRITSTTRTPHEDKAVGGTGSGDHTRGLALDVAGTYAQMDKYAKWAKNSGLYRWIGWQVEGHYNHVHVSWTKDGTETKGSYTVQAGDTLSGIAGKFKMDLEQIKELNKQITNPNLILVGQKINIGNGKTHIVTAGETLSSIAKDNGISLAALKKSNPQIKNFDLIRVGEKINVPFS
jgi:LysM repeat protein